MRHMYLTEEERLARKLIGFLLSFFALLVFGGIVFYIASIPPQEPVVQPEVPIVQNNTGELEDTFRDRIARVRLGGWTLAKRKEEAGKLLIKAPKNSTLRKEVEGLIVELDRESQEQERYARHTEFLKLKSRLVKLYSKNNFNEAKDSILDFSKKVKGFENIQDMIVEEKHRCERYRLRAYLNNKQRAEELINRGDVAEVKSLQAETLKFVPERYKSETLDWIALAEKRKADKAKGIEVAENIQGKDSNNSTTNPESQKLDNNPQVSNPAVEKNSGHTEQVNPKPVNDSSIQAGAFFEGVITVASEVVNNMFAVEGKEIKIFYDPVKTKVFVDEIIPVDQFSENLPRGCGVWVLGIPQVEKINLKQLGLTIIKKIAKPKFLFLADNFFPDLNWEDETFKNRKWNLAKVEMSFPILRVTIDTNTFYVDTGKIVVIKRRKVASLNTPLKGKKVWVEGANQSGNIMSERIIILADKLAGDSVYLKICR